MRKFDLKRWQLAVKARGNELIRGSDGKQASLAVPTSGPEVAHHSNGNQAATNLQKVEAVRQPVDRSVEKPIARKRLAGLLRNLDWRQWPLAITLAAAMTTMILVIITAITLLSIYL